MKEKQCALCGEDYIPTSNNQKYCPECRKITRRQFYSNMNLPKCSRCGRPFRPQPDGLAMCSTCQKKQMEQNVAYDRKLLMANNTRGETISDFARDFGISLYAARKLWGEVERKKQYAN